MLRSVYESARTLPGAKKVLFGLDRECVELFLFFAQRFFPADVMQTLQKLLR